jgi:hypothetical protein
VSPGRPCPARSLRTAIAATVLLTAGAGCRDGSPTSPPPRNGVVRVEVATSGPAAATARWVGASAVSVTGIPLVGGPLGVSSGASHAAIVLSPGTYLVTAYIEFTLPPPTRLRFPLLCSWRGGDSKPATVVAGELTVLGFTLDCVPPGGLMVTTNTSGPGAPPEQLTVWVEKAAAPQLDENGNEIPYYPGEFVAPNGFATIPLSAGPHVAELRGLPPHCTVGGGTKQSVAVQEDVMTYLDLRIRCE